MKSREEILTRLLSNIGYSYNIIKDNDTGFAKHMIEIAEQAMEEYDQQPRFPVTRERILKALYESANMSMKEDCVDVTVTFAKQADAIMHVLSESSPAGAAEGVRCKCPDNIKHGQTSVMCCNHCGLPDEDFWNNCG